MKDAEMIYINGHLAFVPDGDNLVPMENIFEAVNPGRPDLLYTVRAEHIGRLIEDILSEWVNRHHTYYYLSGVKMVFELK